MTTTTAMTNRAGFWKRVFATCIDLIPIFVLWVCAQLIWPSEDGRHPTQTATLAFYIASLLYFSADYFFAATPGKWLFGLRIYKLDGQPANRWRLLLRWQTKYLPLIAVILFDLTGCGHFYVLGGFENLVLCVGCLMALNEDHLTWHDQWAGTAVYRIRAHDAAAGNSNFLMEG